MHDGFKARCLTTWLYPNIFKSSPYLRMGEWLGLNQQHLKSQFSALPIELHPPFKILFSIKSLLKIINLNNNRFKLTFNCKPHNYTTWGLTVWMSALPSYRKSIFMTKSANTSISHIALNITLNFFT